MHAGHGCIRCDIDVGFGNQRPVRTQVRLGESAAVQTDPRRHHLLRVLPAGNSICQPGEKYHSSFSIILSSNSINLLNHFYRDVSLK